MVSDPDNLAANIIMLIRFVARMADTLSVSDIASGIQTLMPLAAGSMPVAVLEADARARNPPNAFKFDMGTPEELRGTALYAIAELSCTGKISPLAAQRLELSIEDGLAHVSSNVRSLALVAASRARTLEGKTLTSVILKVWDPDPEVGARAIGAICGRADFHPDGTQWWMLGFGIRDSLQKSDAQLKRAAAASICRLQETASSEEQKVFCAQLRQAALNDIHFSVRQEVLAADRKTKIQSYNFVLQAEPQ
jgi:hypothetical protein